MVRTILFLFLAFITLGVLATPFAAGVGVLLLLFFPIAFFWWVGLAVTTRGHPNEAILHTRVHHFLGPGGPDDPFANASYVDAEELRWPSHDDSEMRGELEVAEA